MFAWSQVVLEAGKYYWEVKITEGGADGTSGYGILAGVSTIGATLTGVVAAAINAAQPNSAGSAFFNSRANNGVEHATGWGYPVRPAGITAGQALLNDVVFGLALDAVNRKIWWRNITDGVPAAGAWDGGASPTGNPATNTGGADLAALAVDGPLYVLVGASHGSAAAKGAGVINFGATAFTGTAPTGFNSIYSVFPGAALNPNDNSNITLSGGNLTFDGTDVPVTFSPAISGFTTNVGYHNAVRGNFAIAQST